MEPISDGVTCRCGHRVEKHKREVEQVLNIRLPVSRTCTVKAAPASKGGVTEFVLEALGPDFIRTDCPCLNFEEVLR